MSVVSAVFCQVEVSATYRSLVQRSLTECNVTECDCEGCWTMGRVSRLVLKFTQLDIGWRLGTIFPEIKRLERETDYSPPSSGEAEDE